jgi:hypothetical protein
VPWGKSGEPLWIDEPTGFTWTATVRMVVTLPEAGTATCAGLIVHISPGATPAQPKLTDPDAPLVEFSETVKFVFAPTLTVAEAPGETVAVNVPTVICTR